MDNGICKVLTISVLLLLASLTITMILYLIDLTIQCIPIVGCVIVIAVALYMGVLVSEYL